LLIRVQLRQTKFHRNVRLLEGGWQSAAPPSYPPLVAALMGLSLAGIFLVFTGASIARVFFITAATFAAMSLYGYTTGRDLSRFGAFLFMGLIGIIIAGLVNIFIGSSALQFAISVIGVILFTGLTAYDTQRIKQVYLANTLPT
jgi:FtsH-binding integral membrane protein